MRPLQTVDTIVEAVASTIEVKTHVAGQEQGIYDKHSHSKTSSKTPDKSSVSLVKLSQIWYNAIAQQKPLGDCFMAKIISQFTLADYGFMEKILGDLERLELALEGLDDERLMLLLESKRYKGRDDYPIRVMWNLFVAMKIFAHRTVASFRRELSRNSQLRKICGLDDFARKRHLVPPARVFSGFIKTLANEQAEIDRIFTETVSELAEKLPGFGKNAAGDGKYLDSYAKGSSNDPNPDAKDRAENDAAW